MPNATLNWNGVHLCKYEYMFPIIFDIVKRSFNAVF